MSTRRISLGPTVAQQNKAMKRIVERTVTESDQSEAVNAQELIDEIDKTLPDVSFERDAVLAIMNEPIYGGTPDDYLRKFLRIGRVFAYATEDGSWNEFAKEFAVIVSTMVRMKRSARTIAKAFLALHARGTRTPGTMEICNQCSAHTDLMLLGCQHHCASSPSMPVDLCPIRAAQGKEG